MIDTNLDWLLLSDHLSRWASLSSLSVTAADMPLSYLISSQQPTDRCRFIDLGSPIVFTADLTVAMAAQSVTSWRVLVLTHNNSSADGTFSVSGNLGFSIINRHLWPSPDCTRYRRIHSYIYVPAGVPDTILTITINDPNPRKPAINPSGFEVADYFEIGGLLIDYGIRSDLSQVVRPQGTVSEGLDEESKLIVSEGGPIFPRIRPRSSRKSFSLRFVNKAAYRDGMRGFGQMRRDVGVSEAVMLIENLNGVAYMMDGMTYGLFDGLQDASLTDDNNFEVVVRIREML